MNEGFLGILTGKKSTCNVKDLDLILGLGRSSGEGHDNPLLKEKGITEDEMVGWLH